MQPTASFSHRLPPSANPRDAVRALTERIRSCSADTERNRSLPRDLAHAMAEAGLYALFLPETLGGAETDPLTYFDVIEMLTAADSAAGWSVLISTSSMTSMARGLPDDVIIAMFTGPRLPIMAGSAPPRGKAERVEGGYRITGRWSQGSNIRVSDWVHVGCIVHEDGTPLLNAEGRVEQRMAAVPAAAFTIHDTWDTTGMRGTGSHDYSLNDVFVPAARTHTTGRPSARPQPLYQFAGWTHVAHAAHALAIARRAIDSALELAAGKRSTWLPGEGVLQNKSGVQSRIGEAEALVGSARAYVRETTADLWQKVGRGSRPEPRDRAVYRLAIAHAMTNAVRAVDMMYTLAGATAIYRTSPLDRCLRDIHTAAAHVWVTPDTYELAGRLLLGLDPGTPLI